MALTPHELLTLGFAGPHLLANRISRGKFRLWRHIDYIGTEIAAAVQRGNARMIINLGPRWGKSELISVATPTWFLMRWPHKRVILASASSPLATQWGSRNRNNFNEHPELGVITRDDSSAKQDWLTTKGGGMRSVGIGTAVLGFGAHLMIVDDPYGGWDDAQSVTYRRGVEDWYMATAESRLEPGASVILLQHRMHPMDLSAFLLKGTDGKRWQHISLPSIALEADVLGRMPGESLDPERWSLADLEAKRAAMRGMFEPMHQQNPMALTAGAAYRNFGQHNLDSTVAFDPALPLDVSLDFNINPGMHLILGQHNRLTDIATVFDEIHGQGMSVEGACVELARRIKLWPVKPKEIRYFGDRGGVQRSISTGQTHYDAFVRGMQHALPGIELRDRVADPAPRVVERLGSFNYALRDVNGKVWYKVHPRCEILIRDLTSVQMDDKGGVDKSDPLLSHASEAEGYRIHVIRGFRIPIKPPAGQFSFGGA